MTTTSRVYYPQNARRHVENVRDTSNAILKRARLADQLQFLAALHPDEFARGSVLEIVVIVPQDPSCELSKRVQRRLQELYSPFPLYALTYGYPRELCPLFSETEVPSFGILPSAPLKLASLVPALSKQPTGAREGRGIDEDGQEPGRVDPPFGSVQPTNSHSTFQSCVHLFKSTEQRELLQELRVRADIETEWRGEENSSTCGITFNDLSYSSSPVSSCYIQSSVTVQLDLKVPRDDASRGFFKVIQPHRRSTPSREHPARYSRDPANQFELWHDGDAVKFYGLKPPRIEEGGMTVLKEDLPQVLGLYSTTQPPLRPTVSVLSIWSLADPEKTPDAYFNFCHIVDHRIPIRNGIVDYVADEYPVVVKVALEQREPPEAPSAPANRRVKVFESVSHLFQGVIDR